MSDVISSEDPQHGSAFPPAGPSPRRPRSGARATALTTAVSLVLVGGVVTAAVRGSGHETSAESLAPASSFAFAQLDLGLADGQSGALSSFLAHFPGSPSKRGHGSLRDRLLAAMLHDSSDPHVDYAKDVKPWLGDRAAIAGWLDAHGKPQVEYLLQSTDDAAARSSLHRLDPTLGVAFSDGYAVVARTEALAQAALAAAKRSSLANDAHLDADLAQLAGPQVISGWADLGRAAKAVAGAFAGKSPFTLLPGAALPGLAASQLKGRVVVGVYVTDTYAELVAHALDAAPATAALAPSAMLTRLPDATIGAAEIASPGKVVSAAWQFASGLFGIGQSFTATATMPGMYGSTGTVCLSGGSCTTLPAQAPPVVNATPARQPTPAEQVEKATGLKMPADAVTLLGSAAVVAYGGLHGGGLPNIALVSRPTDLVAARALAEHSRDVIAQHTGVAAAVGSTGSDLVVATSADYEHAVESGGHLGSVPRFTTAMGTMPAQVGFAAYVDLADILPLVSHGNPDLAHLDALGLWTGRVGNDEQFQVRLVVR